MAIIERLRHAEVEGIRVGRFRGRISTTCIVYRFAEVVIDTGPPNQWRWVKRFIQEHQPRQVLITHHHEDHGGNGARLQKELSLPLLAHREGVPLLQNGFKVHLYRKIIWGTPPSYVAEAVDQEIHLSGGETLLPVLAPGHSRDMTCFLLKQRGWLFSGDLYIASRPKFLRRDENPKQEIESLKKVLQLDFDVLFCAHRGIVKNGKQALQDKLDFLLELHARIAQLYAQGKSLGEITRELLGREEVLSWLTFFHFSKRNLIRGLL